MYFFIGSCLLYYLQMIKRKIMDMHLFVNRERKNIFLARQISAQQRGVVMAFIPD